LLAIIGGSGLAQLADLSNVSRRIVRTPYGDPSCPLTFGTLAGREIVFLARHGYGHTIAPHDINYRANLWALHQAGISQVISVASVGGLREDLGPGVLCIPDQIIDYTWGRKSTWELAERQVRHIDFTEPYDEQLRQLLIASARSVQSTTTLQVVQEGTYGVTQGPRLETAAEIRRMRQDGCDLVGMTGMPEAALARELGLQYACLAVVSNHAAGIGSSAHEIHVAQINAALDAIMQNVRKVLAVAVMAGS
jgi:5'-deoxy-5'-methylthioadenosine phosphorylase